jgi:ubiquinone biosynthesis protein COQ9
MKLDWNQVARNGIFAVLFVALLAFTMQENSKRETELKQIIQEQNAVMNKLSDVIKMDLAEIKAYVMAKSP